MVDFAGVQETEVVEPQVPTRVPMTVPDLPVVETERDVFARNRAAVCAALLANGHRQIMGSLYGKHGRMCFVGLAALVVKGEGP